MSKKATILLATYNGEKYLKELLDSLLAQTYKNVCIYIRDDNSTDNTRDILEYYSKKYNNILVSYGDKNLGYPQCFFSIIDSAPDSDYYFFADQDDVWFPIKIERAINKISKLKNKNAVYFSGYDICDEKLNIIGKSRNRKNPKIEFHETLYGNLGLEFTMCLTKEALNLFKENKPQRAKTRGMWMNMLYSSLGEIYYDNISTAYYRRHPNTVTLRPGIELWKWRIKNFILNNQLEQYRIIVNDFYDICYEKLKENDKYTLSIFHSSSKLKKVFYKRRLRTLMSDELALRFAFWLGKL